jgi:hypothetical protein
MVEAIVQMSEGRNMSEGLTLPDVVRRDITVVGIICTDVAFTINSSFCA